MGLEAGVGGVPGRFRREQLRHVGVGPAILAGLEQRRGSAADHVGGLDLSIGAGQRELDALVLADRLAKDDAFLGVFAALLSSQRPSPMHSWATRMRSAFIPSR